MIAALKRLLRGWVLTRDEQELLSDAPRAVFRDRLLTKLLRWDQLMLVQALEKPERFMPDEKITRSEGEAWGAAIASPVGMKVDLAMINMAQQQAVIAVLAEPADIQRKAGYAAGFRAAWHLVRHISTIASTDAGNSEAEATTGTPNLDHLRP